MPIPFRNNPKISTNWFNAKTDKFLKNTVKRSYYDISTSKPGWLRIAFREEKKRLGGSGELERHWLGYLEFELDSQFAKDLEMFLREHMEEEDAFKA